MCMPVRGGSPHLRRQGGGACEGNSNHGCGRYTRWGGHGGGNTGQSGYDDGYNGYGGSQSRGGRHQQENNKDHGSSWGTATKHAGCPPPRPLARSPPLPVAQASCCWWAVALLLSPQGLICLRARVRSLPGTLGQGGTGGQNDAGGGGGGYYGGGGAHHNSGGGGGSNWCNSNGNKPDKGDSGTMKCELNKQGYNRGEGNVYLEIKTI